MGNERLLEGQPVERGGTVHLQLKRTRELELFCQELDDFEEFTQFLWSLLGIIACLGQIVLVSQPILHRLWNASSYNHFCFVLHETH